MLDPFQIRARGGATVESLLFDRLDAQGTEFTVVDVGARNGMILPQSLARRSRVVGFEPNPVEYAKLAEHRTDAERAGVPVSHFKAEEYHNCALWRADEVRPFYVTAGPGACTLMGKTLGSMTRRIWREGDTKSYESTHTDVRETLPMQCRRLDSILSPGRKVDLLKLDVEGAEAPVLEGAAGLLAARTVLFVKSEFVFTPYYEAHPVLGHQHVLLHEHGFRLIDLDLTHPRYTRDRTALPATADRRLIYAGDAYFVLDPDRPPLEPEDAYRMAVFCIAFGFRSLAVSLLRDSRRFSEADLVRIESALASVPWPRRLTNFWNNTPKRVARLLGL